MFHSSKYTKVLQKIRLKHMLNHRKTLHKSALSAEEVDVPFSNG